MMLLGVYLSFIDKIKTKQQKEYDYATKDE